MLVRAAMGSHSSSNNLWKVWERFCLTSVSCFQQPALKLSQQTAGPALADPSARAHVALCAAGRCEPDTGKRENLERKPANVVAHCGGSNPPWSPMLMLRSCLTVCEQFIPSYPDAGENPQVRSFCFILMFNQFLSIGRRLYIYIHTYIYIWCFSLLTKRNWQFYPPCWLLIPEFTGFKAHFLGPKSIPACRWMVDAPPAQRISFRRSCSRRAKAIRTGHVKIWVDFHHRWIFIYKLYNCTPTIVGT